LAYDFLCTLLVVAIVDNNISPRRGQAEGDGLADSGRGTCHQGFLPLE